MSGAAFYEATVGGRVYHGDVARALCEATARAERAEARIRAVEALCDQTIWILNANDVRTAIGADA